MPLLGFQSRFASLVESGQKRQTIRAYRKDGRDPKVGDRLHLWTGLRQKWARKLGEAIATRVNKIELHAAPGVEMYVMVSGRYPKMLSVDESEVFANRDGFDHLGEMQDWFERVHGLPFIGLLIEWGDLEK